MLFKIKTAALVAGLAVMLAMPGTGFASNIAKRHVAVGTISSIDNSRVVIEERVKGKEQPMTFMLQSSTKEVGNMTPGSRVSVHYRYRNHERVATSIHQRTKKTAHG